MDIFKVYESTMANVQPDASIKHLRRDQLLDNYEAASRTLQTLIRAKENEISHRKDLIKMLEESKTYHDNRLHQGKQVYQTVKSYIPETIDLKSISIKLERSTTPPLPPPQSVQISSATAIDSNTVSMQTIPARIPSQIPTIPQQQMNPSIHQAPPMLALPHHFPVTSPAASQSSSIRSSDHDIPLPSDNYNENRSSLDRRLSEFLKTFPNMNQAGTVTPGNPEAAQKPTPGYYTQQPPIPTAPPSIEMLRFPPPNMMPPIRAPMLPTRTMPELQSNDMSKSHMGGRSYDSRAYDSRSHSRKRN